MEYTNYTKRAILNEIIQASLNINQTERVDVFVNISPHVNGFDLRIFPDTWKNTKEDNMITISEYYKGGLSDRDLMINILENLNRINNNLLLGNCEPLEGVIFKNDIMVNIRENKQDKELKNQMNMEAF